MNGTLLPGLPEFSVLLCGMEPEKVFQKHLLREGNTLSSGAAVKFSLWGAEGHQCRNHRSAQQATWQACFAYSPRAHK